MGVLSDFVIADGDEAEAIGESDHPAERWPTLEGWKGIETIKLSTLYCAITGETYSNDLQCSFELVGGDKEEGPWVFEFPQKVTDAFAAVAQPDMAKIAQQWAATEELAMDLWTATEAHKFIEQICAHAQRAKKSNKKLFLWFSL